ncbi:MAG: hypothetical protein IJW33_03180 [Lentisphaeria bacterium]|nr:hypothetical protein [Lentisphaeria bacterium]
MKKILALLLSFITAAALRGAGELRLADATGGAPLEAVMQAALTLSMAEELSVSMQRQLPTAALAALEAGKVDAVIIDRTFVPNKEVIPLAAEALALYISTANPGAKVTKAQVGEILKAFHPSWKDYNRLNLDIQRVVMKPLTPSGTLIRRIFGNNALADEVFMVDSFSSGFTFINSAAVFFAQYIPQAPVEVKCMPVNGVMPTTADIVSGKYPLSLHYVIVYRKKSPALLRLIDKLKEEKYRRSMIDSGLIVLLPRISAP